MLEFSDYIVYVDESGDHELTSISSGYPVFVLAFCIFQKSTYVNEIVPQFQSLKFRWFGHDSIVLHEREIRKQLVPFKFLQNQTKRAIFINELTACIAESSFTVIASIIDKTALRRRYSHPANPYQIGMQFCIERLVRFLEEKGQNQKLTHCIFEKRGPPEDRDLELEFRRICDGANYAQRHIETLEMRFVDKSANSTGLQLSDLVARPIGLSYLRPHQPNRAYELIRTKFRKNRAGDFKGYGLKVFP